LWQGRSVKVEDGIQYYYQVVEILDKDEIPLENNYNIGFLGYACDEGVRRNQGSVGAAYGPKAFRTRMSKLAFHYEDLNVVDVGDVFCESGDMESCQKTFGSIISDLIQKQIFPIAIGGGHDIAYGHFEGVKNAIRHRSSRKIGIINFDAHFDLRPIEGQANSGTPFKQILDEDASVEYFVVGIQKASNTKSLFQIANKYEVGYVLNNEAILSRIDEVKMKLYAFMERNDYLYVSIDLDGFSSAFAPGVSAPSPFGFSPMFVQEVLSYVFQSGKVISCDIAELNPLVDNNLATSRLAAQLVDVIIDLSISDRKS
ncbi:UNVERIFIED_CONTAM: hypothetical protein GTU68_060508, partial [Idotea baltica]|nr:hypothetical protein [Idotea baltica]